MVIDASEVERAPARQSDVNLYFPMAILCAGVAFLGFAPTYWAPILFGTLNVHPIILGHSFSLCRHGSRQQGASQDIERWDWPQSLSLRR